MPGALPPTPPTDETRAVSSTEAVTSPAPATAPSAGAVGEEQANRAFSTSILVSGIRCLLAYIVFPWLLPALGLARGVGPGIGLAIGPIAIVFNLLSIRRFHASDHRWKWWITALNCTVIALLTVLLVLDIRELVG